MSKPDLSIIFDILLNKWSSFLGSIDIVVITHIINEILKNDMRVFRKTIREIASGSGTSLPSVFKALEKAECFNILEVGHDEKVTRVQFGKKLRLELAKKC